MCRNSSKLYFVDLVLGLLGVFSLSGCAYVDCGFEYHVHGTLIDSSTKEPMPYVKMDFSDNSFDVTKEDPNWPGFSYTDGAGNFKDTFSTGITWGFQLLFGFIPIGSTKGPLPPEIQHVVLYVEKSHGSWYVQQIPVAAAQQKRVAPAERWIELGTISISEVRDNN